MTIRKLRIIEFVLIGLFFNALDNVIAVKYAAGAELDWNVLARIFIFVVPFAILSELVVDHPNFWKKTLRFLRIEIKEVEKKL